MQSCKNLAIKKRITVLKLLHWTKYMNIIQKVWLIFWKMCLWTALECFHEKKNDYAELAIKCKDNSRKISKRLRKSIPYIKVANFL